MINLGIGTRRVADAGQHVVETPEGNEIDEVENGGGDLLDKVEQHINSAEGVDGPHVNGSEQTHVQMQDEQEDDPDVSVLNTIIEEMYERFKDAEINEILKICREVLGSSQTGRDELDIQD